MPAKLNGQATLPALTYLFKSAGTAVFDPLGLGGEITPYDSGASNNVTNLFLKPEPAPHGVPVMWDNIGGVGSIGLLILQFKTPVSNELDDVFLNMVNCGKCTYTSLVASELVASHQRKKVSTTVYTSISSGEVFTAVPEPASWA